MFKRKREYLIPVLGFLFIILVGAIILYLPCCTIGTANFIDTLFTSTSATTTTGFSLNDISTKYTTFGKIIITILMNIGAVGFISLIVVIVKLKNRRISLSNMKVINDSISDDNYLNLKDEVFNIVKYVAIIEIIGAFLLAIKFIPEYGVIKGIGYSLFHSISAFSNTGFDLLGENGFIKYNKDIYIRLVIIILMILGGIGFLPINDYINNKSKKFKKLKLQSKIVIIYSFALILISTIGLKIFEGSNISWLNALFMGATARNTGLYTVSVSTMTVPSKLFILILMIVGGAPGSTAGGIKVVVFAVLEAVVITTLLGKKEVVLFWRKIDENTIRLSVTILAMFIVIILIATMAIVALNNFGLFDVLFACVSGISSTGLSSTSMQILNNAGKFILMTLMFIGRVGPLSILAIFTPEVNNEKINFPEEKLIL